MGGKEKGNIVNDTVISVYGDRWVQEISGEHFVSYMAV